MSSNDDRKFRLAEDMAFSKLFASTPSTSGKNELKKQDSINAIRVLSMYLLGVIGVEVIPILMNTDWSEIAGPRWGYVIATVLGLVSGAIMDVFRRWKTDYTPNKTGSTDTPDNSNPYNGI